jgi:subtilisin family serine protease
MKSFALLAVLPAVLAGPTINKRQTDNTIPGQWIATLEENAVLPTVLKTVKLLTGIKPKHQYSQVGGFAFSASDAVVDLLSSVGALKNVEPDQRVSITAPLPEPEDIEDDVADEEDSLASRAMVTQSDAVWGLSRVAHKNASVPGYIRDESDGAGTTVYVVDTGIYTDNQDFQGRAVQAVNFVESEENTDLQGHGTHCAGTIGGIRYGVVSFTSQNPIHLIASL